MKAKSDSASIKLPDEVMDDLRKVSLKLSSFQKSDFVDRSLFEPSVALLSRRSKLMRPALVLVGAYAVGEDPDDFIDLAVASELLHTASLIHDDIIDRDTVRRGSFAVHEKYGEHVAILAGDALIAKAVSMAAGYGPEVLKSITQASMDACAGETIDYNYQKNGKVPGMKEYMKIAGLKSASLIGACCGAGAVYGSDSSSKDIYMSGRDLGIAFQVRDDIMDFIGALRGRKQPASNVVLSLQKDYKIGSHQAVMRAVKINNDYVDMSRKRMKGSKYDMLLRGYAELIRVSA